jgi:hypothetical protein
MKLIPMKSVVSSMQGVDYHPGDLRLPQKDGPTHGPIQQAVHGNEGTPGGHASRRKGAIYGQTSFESKGDKQRLSDCLPMGKTALVTVHV